MPKQTASKHTSSPLFTQVLNTVLPPQEATSAHITGVFNEWRAAQHRHHQGVDFNYAGGQNLPLNQAAPPIFSPIAGTVVLAGKGTVYNTVSIQDEHGFLHKFLHNKDVVVKVGDHVQPGDCIASMGKFASQAYHVHYEIVSPKMHARINPEQWWNERPGYAQKIANQSTKASVNQSAFHAVPAQDQNQSSSSNALPAERIQLNQHWRYGSYEKDCAALLLNFENLKQSAYFDGRSIAIGIGYDLMQHSNRQIQRDFAQAGIPPLTPKQETLLNQARVTHHLPTRQALAEQLDLRLESRQKAHDLKQTILPRYEEKLSRLLGKDVDLPPSAERIALLSMAYHGRLKGQVLEDVKQGLAEGDRAKVYWTIASSMPANHKPIHTAGFIKRFCMEAAYFNLYEQESYAQTSEKTQQHIQNMAALHMHTYKSIKAFYVKYSDRFPEVKDFLTHMDVHIAGNTINKTLDVAASVAPKLREDSYINIKAANHAIPQTSHAPNTATVTPDSIDVEVDAAAVEPETKRRMGLRL